MPYPDDLIRNDQVAHDLGCPGCHYNLRGMHCSSCCPECGAAVSDAVEPKRLCFANAQWLREIHRCIYALAYGGRVLAGVIILTFITQSTVSVPAVTLAPGVVINNMNSVVVIMVFLLGLTAACGLIVGGLLMMIRCREPQTLRRVPIAAIGFAPCLAFAIIASICADMNRQYISMAVLAWLLLFACFIGLLSHVLRQIVALCNRIPDDNLSSMAQRRREFMVISGLASAALIGSTYDSILSSGVGWLFLLTAAILTLLAVYLALRVFALIRPKISRALDDAQTLEHIVSAGTIAANNTND